MKINWDINLKSDAFLKIYLLFFSFLTLLFIFFLFLFYYHIVELTTNVYWTRLLILSFECDCIRQWKMYLDSIREEQKDFPFYISRTYKDTFLWWIFNEPSLHNPSSFECKSLGRNSRGERKKPKFEVAPLKIYETIERILWYGKSKVERPSQHCNVVYHSNTIYACTETKIYIYIILHFVILCNVITQAPSRER